jgi:hypothetical protein
MLCYKTADSFFYAVFVYTLLSQVTDVDTALSPVCGLEDYPFYAMDGNMIFVNVVDYLFPSFLEVVIKLHRQT